jgi:beta-glucosidase
LEKIMDVSRHGFPGDFRWGAATASYQVEGAVHEDGRGESIWDRFCTVPGAIADGSSGEVACDHYHRWQEDVALMHEMGLDSYRFSVAWPRIFPEGSGKPNQASLDFYSRLIDGLRAAGITPFVTIYHWDLPQALQDRGGWANRDTASIFADYADTLVRHFSDRVPYWITHNEPAVSTLVGHLEGRHAPGTRDPRIAYQAVHNMLLSHGLAVKALRATNSSAQVGITLNLFPIHPATAAPEDIEAARVLDGLDNRLFLDPVFLGRYPEDIVEALGPVAPTVAAQSGDLVTISAPLDFLGVNYYRRKVAHPDPTSPYLGVGTVSPPESEYTQMGWEVTPDGLREILVRVHNEYKAPAIYITENGAAFPDRVEPDGTVHDRQRVAYLESHIDACAQAIAAGVPLKGYFVWSLMDNFEWGLGYTRRFGVIYVDYPTQRRIWKDSALWYQGWIAVQRGR